jgi:ketosteroid isomerase-like protein
MIDHPTSETFTKTAPRAEGAPGARSARDVLTLYHRAMAAKSADDLAALYAPDAVHEFSFFTPNRPSRLLGRESVRASYKQGWERHPLEIDAIDDVFVVEGADPEMIVGQWQLVGIVRSTRRPVAITGLLVLRVHDGFIVHARDFVDGLGVADALGRAPFALGVR